jgi:hypothetical protein
MRVGGGPVSGLRTMTPQTQRLLFLFLVVLGFLTRASLTKSPLLDHHGWRQADTASIARNFFRDEFNILHPQVDWRGTLSKGYVATGLELHAYLVAALAFVIGFRVSHGRLLSCVWFLVSATLLHRFLRDRYGGMTALAGTGAYVFGFPLVMYMDRTFMNEPLLLMLTFLSYRAAQRHVATDAWSSYGAMAVATTLLAVIKAPYLVVWGGVLGLFAERFGWRTFRLWRVLAVVGVNLVAVATWYSYAHTLGNHTGLSFGLDDKLYDPAVVWSLNFWVVLIQRLGKDVLGPVGLIALVWGAVVAIRSHRRFEPAALGGAVVYFVAVAKGNLVHDYYQLPIVPVGAVLVALGLVAIATKAGRGDVNREAAVLTAAMLMMAASTFLRTYNSWYGYAWEKTQVCAEGGRLMMPADRLLLIGDGNPELMFCLDRPGWLSAPESLDAARLDTLRGQGASVVLIPSTLENPAVLEWLAAHARPLLRNPRYILLRVG